MHPIKALATSSAVILSTAFAAQANNETVFDKMVAQVVQSRQAMDKLHARCARIQNEILEPLNGMELSVTYAAAMNEERGRCDITDSNYSPEGFPVITISVPTMLQYEGTLDYLIDEMVGESIVNDMTQEDREAFLQYMYN